MERIVVNMSKISAEYEDTYDAIKEYLLDTYKLVDCVFEYEIDERGDIDILITEVIT